MTNIEHDYETAVNMVRPLIFDNADISTYIETLKLLSQDLMVADEDAINKLKYTAQIKNILRRDRYLLKMEIKKQCDRISLLSTLAVYSQCNREKMPDDNHEFNNRVLYIKDKIDQYFGEESQRYFLK